MMKIFGVICALLFFVIIDTGTNAYRIILPPPPQHPEIPTCSSYSSLCNLMYNLTDTESYQIHNSNQQICRCTDGHVCETEWESRDRSIFKVFRGSGQEIEVKMSYCTLPLPDNVCRQNEVAVVTRGRGPLTFEIVSDFRCRCYRRMYAHRSWREGDYNYFEYSCGKPRCAMNRTPTTDCMKITYAGSPTNLTHDYLCRCRWNEECVGAQLPTAENPSIMHTCQIMPPEAISRRNELRQQRQRSLRHK